MRRAASALLLSSVIAAAGCETGSSPASYTLSTPPRAVTTTAVRPAVYIPPPGLAALPSPRFSAPATASPARPAPAAPVLGTPSPAALRSAPTSHTSTAAVRPVTAAPPRAAQPSPAPAVRPAAAAPSMTVLATDQTFDRELAAATTPVLLTFTAKWCGPCHAAAPVLDAFGVEHAGRVKVIRIDFDQSPQVVRRYGVSALPAVLLVSNGVVVKRMVGYQSRENLAAALASVRP